MISSPSLKEMNKVFNSTNMVFQLSFNICKRKCQAAVKHIKLEVDSLERYSDYSTRRRAATRQPTATLL